MRGIWTSSSAALLCAACCGLQLTGTPAMAAACDGSSEPCSVDLGRVNANFASGAASYYAEAVLVNGSDASYNASPLFLSALALTHTADSDGFMFSPQVYASVGGSGINGLHEVTASLQFTGLSFSAEPGYRITGVDAMLTGSFALVGNGYGGLSVPAALQWNGQAFSATLALDPAAADLQLGFAISASYVEGDDGTAASYGTGSASFDSLAFIARVAAVPEPASTAQLALGLAVLLPHLATRHRRAAAAADRRPQS